MGILDKALKRGVSNGVERGVGRGIENAVSNAVSKVFEPRATKIMNKAADQMDEAAGIDHNSNTNSGNIYNNEPGMNGSSGMNASFANLQRSAEAYATAMASNMKVCSECGNGATSDKTYCPTCGAKLPETTMASGAVCSQCGKQNTVGTKFCQDCGSKLPGADNW